MTTVKVLDSNKEIAKYRFKKGEVLRLQAEKQVHYQLVDDATGRAPQNILAKRIGNDLHIALDEDNLDTDIIIENYYYLDKENAPDTENALVGLHENGRIYYYIPESGLENDAVSMLAEQVIKPQALGGEEIVAPFWFWNPWWIAGGLLAVGAGVALASGGGSKGAAASNPIPDAPTFKRVPEGILISLPSTKLEVGDKVTLKYIDNNGTEQVVTLTRTASGWESSDPSFTPDASGQILLPNSKRQYGSTIVGVTEDAVTGTQKDSNLTFTPAKIETPEDSAAPIKITPPTDAVAGDKMVISYVPAGQTEPVEVVLVKQPDGSWKPKDPNAPLKANSDGTFDLPIESVAHNSPVSAKVVDGVTGNTLSTPEGVTTPNPYPVAPAVELVKGEGATITPNPKNLEAGDTVVVKYNTPTGEESFTLTYTGDSWTSTDSPFPVDPTMGKVSIPADRLTPNYKVSATAFDKATNTANNTTFDAENKLPNAPTVTSPSKTDEGFDAVSITPPSENVEEGDKVQISYIPKGQTIPVTVELTFTNGEWAAPTDSPLQKNADGSFNLPSSVTESNSPVTAKAIDAFSGESIDAESGSTDNLMPQAPEIVANKDGSVDVTLATPAKNVEEGDKTTLTFTTPTGKEVVVNFTYKDGKWTTSEESKLTEVGATFDPETGTVSIPDNAVDDNTPVTAVTFDAINTNYKAPAEKVAETPVPTPPTIENPTTGELIITPSGDEEPGDKVTVTYKDPETGESKTITIELKLDPEGNPYWESDNTEFSADPETGKVTIPADKVDNNDDIEAVTIAGGDSSKQASIPPAPTVTANDDYSITVEMPTENVKPGDIVTVTYMASDDNEVTLKYKLGEDGQTWEPVDGATALTDNKLNLPNGSVKSGAPVNAVTTDGETGINSDVDRDSKNPLPAEPSIVANDNGSVDITLPAKTNNVEENDTALVEFNTLNGEKVSVTLTFNGDNWTITPEELQKIIDLGGSFNSDTGIISLPDNAVDDNTPVKAKTTDAIDGSEHPAEDTSAKTPKPTAPTVERPEDGSLVITPSGDEEPDDKVTVTYIDENGDEQTLTITLKLKENDAGEKVPVWESDNPNFPADPATGKVTIPANNIDTTKKVTAQTESGADPSKTSDEVKLPESPALTKGTDGIDVTMPNEGVEEGDISTVTYVDKSGDTITLRYQKTGDSWEPLPKLVNGTPSEETSPALTNNTVKLPNDQLKDGTVSASTTDKGTGSNSEPNEVTKNDLPTAPGVAGKDDGSVEINLNNIDKLAEDDSVTISYTKPDGKPGEITLTYTNGQWGDVSNLPDGATFANGILTLPDEAVDDATDVTATTKDAIDETYKAPETGTAKTPKPTAPTVERPEDGSLVISPSGDEEPGDKVTVTYIDENGDEQTLTITLKLNDDGEPVWESDNPNFPADPATGKVTIPADNIDTTKKVTAQTESGADPSKTSDEVKLPESPALTKGTDGIDVTMPNEGVEEGDISTVTYVDKNGDTITLRYQKTGDSWEPLPKLVNGTPSEETSPALTNNTVKLPNDQLKDGTVSASTTDKGTGSNSEPNEVIKNLLPTSPTVTGNDANGEVAIDFNTIDNLAEGDSVTISYFKPGATDTVTLTLTYTNGQWGDVSNLPDGATFANGVLTLPDSAVKDGEKVTATAKDKVEPTASISSTEGTANPIPKGLDVIANGNDRELIGTASVTVNLPSSQVEEGDRVEIRYVDPLTIAGKTIIVNKTASGWAIEGTTPTGVTLNGNTVTLADNIVRDGKDVTATVIDRVADTYDATQALNNALASDQQSVITDTDKAKDTHPELTVASDETAKTSSVTVPDTLESGDRVLLNWKGPEAQNYRLVYERQTDGSFSLVDKSIPDRKPIADLISYDPATRTFTVSSAHIHDDGGVKAKLADRDQTTGTTTDEVVTPQIDDEISLGEWKWEDMDKPVNDPDQMIWIAAPTNANSGNVFKITLTEVGATSETYAIYTKQTNSRGNTIWALDEAESTLLDTDTVAYDMTTQRFDVDPRGVKPGTFIKAEALASNNANSEDDVENDDNFDNATALIYMPSLNLSVADSYDRDPQQQGKIKVTPDTTSDVVKMSINFVTEENESLTHIDNGNTATTETDKTNQVETASRDATLADPHFEKIKPAQVTRTITIEKQGDVWSLTEDTYQGADRGKFVTVDPTTGEVTIAPNGAMGNTVATIQAFDGTGSPASTTTYNVAEDVALTTSKSAYITKPNTSALYVKAINNVHKEYIDENGNPTGSYEQDRVETAIEPGLHVNSGSGVFGHILTTTYADGTAALIKWTKIDRADALGKGTPTPTFRFEAYRIGDDGVQTLIQDSVREIQGLSAHESQTHWNKGLGGYVSLNGNMVTFSGGIFKEGAKAMLYQLDKNSIQEGTNLTDAQKENLELISTLSDGTEIYTKTPGGWAIAEFTSVYKIDTVGTQPDPIKANVVKAFGAENDTINYSQYFGQDITTSNGINGVIAKLDAGAGTDTLVLNQDGVTISSSQFANLENINATNANALIKLTAADLLSNGSMGLHVQGIQGTRVDFGAESRRFQDGNANWAKTGEDTQDGITYDIYQYGTNTDQTVYIQQDVTII